MESDTPTRYRTRAATAAAEKGKAAKQSTIAAAEASAPAFPRSLSRLADVELQLVMQFLDSNSLLKLARCSRQTLHCASHPSVWRRHLIDVAVTNAGPHKDARASARSLVHLKPSRACLEGNELISCDTLAAVPNLAAVRFSGPVLIMSTLDRQRFLSLPVAQRLVEIELTLHAESDTLHQLSALSLLHTVKLRLVAATSSPSVLQPLVQVPSLTHVSISGPSNTYITPLSVMVPLVECVSMRSLELAWVLHRPPEFRTLVQRLLQNGGRLRHISLSCIGCDVGNLVLDLFCAAEFLPHLKSLRLHGRVLVLFPAVAAMPSLQLLQLEPNDVPCPDTIESLLRRNLMLRVHLQFDDKRWCSPALQHLAAGHPRLKIHFK
jgi:hypothetical protein